ncbi:hypothetical protein PVAP13_4KG270200 [Panicum virgatum]|uniref:Solute carrier family 40 member n=1 Tax=Panicum virgatum TaxID=38727 RepID=A0A8T0TU90_PANVG|nr:hypothetical protein PVAP13_4KG270200 [Panicum virgatum]
MALVVVTNVSGALAALSTLAGTILIEREWVVVISCGHPPAVLTGINSVVRRIDLSCKLLAPVFSGLVFSFVSAQASAAALALWIVASVGLEYWLFVSVYSGVPALAAENGRRRAADDVLLPSPAEEIAAPPAERAADWSWRTRLSIIPCCESWVVYVRQDVALPSVALAFLYFTVLSFGTLMTATLDWKGIPAYVISLARGFSAVVGICATLLYPAVHSRLSTLRTGLWSIWMQWCCLLVCVASIWAGSGVASAWMLMAGVAAGALDVRSRRDAADAGRRAGARAVRGGRGAELAAVRVRPPHLHHGHHHLRPQGFQRADRAVVLPGDLRGGHVHAARPPRAQAPLPLRQDPRQDQLDQSFLN